MPAPLHTVKGLRERCAIHRQSVEVRKLASPEEVAAWWPGGSENPGHNLAAWILCFANLVSFLRRGDDLAKARDQKERRAAIMDALADKPEQVPLLDGTRLTVYPKSYVALEAVHERNTQIAALIDAIALLQDHGTPDDLDLILRARTEQAYLQRLLVWIATTEGPGLPFGEAELAPEPPAALAALHPADLYAIAEAFQRVNVKRLLALDSTRGSETRPDWSVFIATLADEMHRPAGEVMRDMSLAGAIAAAAERARGHEQAMVAAERKAAAKRSKVA